MNIDKHREKAARIERSLAKCRPDDYELRIEAAMLAGTHWLNLALHAIGVTRDDQDVMHTYMLTVNEYRRLAAADERLMTLLRDIEDLRPVYVRGDEPGGRAIGGQAVDMLAQIRNIALAAAATPRSGTA